MLVLFEHLCGLKVSQRFSLNDISLREFDSTLGDSEACLLAQW